MKKRFLYEFNGTVFVEAENEDEAEKKVTGLFLNDFLINEDMFEIDETYVATDPEKRVQQWGTELHPLEDAEDYEQYKIRKQRYSPIFSDFLNGKIGKEEMITQMEQAENKDIPYSEMLDEIQIVDLDTKKEKTVRLVAVD